MTAIFICSFALCIASRSKLNIIATACILLLHLQVTSFSLPVLCSAISAQEYQSVMCLTHLHHLRLVSYMTNITDDDFACLAGLYSCQPFKSV